MSLENACHQWLIDHLSPGRDLAPDAPTPRITLPDDATFGGIRRRVLAAYTTSATAHPGRTAIITAGPPGAGKSYAIAHHDTTGFRVIDPDEIKDLLLDELDAAGHLQERFDYTLPDGNPLGLRELSGWIHRASTDIADQVRATSLQTGENIVIEGTLSWPPLAEEIYVDELDANAYRDVTIIEVAAPTEQVLDQARARWWRARLANPDTGGRFVHPAIIHSMYDENGESIPARNARALADNLHTSGIPARVDSYFRLGNQTTRTTYDPARRTPLTPVPDLPPGNPGGGVLCAHCGQPLTSAESIRRGMGPNCAKKTQQGL